MTAAGLVELAETDPIARELLAERGLVQALRGKIARLEAVADACAKVIGLGDNAAERFEAMAERFYAKTGLLAPGKSEPAECGHSAIRDEGRRLEFRAFVEKEMVEARALLRALDGAR
jgi:hypothetical protein